MGRKSLEERINERVETARGFYGRQHGTAIGFDEETERTKARNAELASDIDAGLVAEEFLPLAELRRTNKLLEEILGALRKLR